MNQNIQQTESVQTIQQQIKPLSKHNSYTYWVDDKNKSRELPPEQRPQKIEPPRQQNNLTENGRSHWNTAGTWELKAINLKQIQKVYENNISKWIQNNCPEITMKTLYLNGQCGVVFIRNKKMLTYEINGKIQFQKNIPEAKVQQTQSKSRNQIQKNEIKSFQIDSENKKGKNKKFTFQIIDLSDSGDRQYLCKADDSSDREFINGKAEQLMDILDEILKRQK